MNNTKQVSKTKANKKQESKQETRLVVYQPPPKKPVAKPQLSIPKAYVEKVCGIVDPFCSHSSGAKYPDSSSVKTLSYTRRTAFTVSTDAGGNANVVFSPQYSFQPQANANVFAGNNVTSWVNFGAASVLADVSAYRVVSCGFIIRHIVSPLNAGGMVYVRLYGTENNLNIAPIDTTTFNATAVLNVSVQDAREVACVLQRTSQMPQVFYPIASDTATVGNVITKGFTSATISVSGGAASTGILHVEAIINFELIFPDDSALAQAATSPPPSNTAIVSAASHVTSQLQPLVIQGVKSFGTTLAKSAATALAGYFGGPSAASATRSALAITVD